MKIMESGLAEGRRKEAGKHKAPGSRELARETLGAPRCRATCGASGDVSGRDAAVSQATQVQVAKWYLTLVIKRTHSAFLHGRDSELKSPFSTEILYN